MEINDEGFQVECLCDGIRLFTEHYSMMLESMDRLDPVSNLTIAVLGGKALTEALSDKPEFDPDDEAFTIIMTMLALSGLTHLEHADVSVCAAVQETVELLRDVIPLSADTLIEKSKK